MFKIDLSRPDIVYTLVWCIPLIMLKFFRLNYFIDINYQTYILLIGSMVSFILVYNLFKLVFVKKGTLVTPLPENLIGRFMKFIDIIIPFWFIIYFIIIFVSGGTPLMWLLTEDSRSYTDFGVPSLSGFIYMFRAFLLVACVFVYLRTKLRKYMFLALIFLFLAFINESSRGNGVVLMLHPIGFILMMKPTKITSMLKYGLFLGLFVIFFGLLEQFRYINNDSYKIVKKYEQTLNVESANVLAVYSLPFLLYVTSPLQNLNYQIVSDTKPLYKPYYSTQALFPTFIREFIFENNTKEYGLLLNDVYNTTSFFSPLIRDFGITLSFAIVFIIQIFVSLVHLFARHSKILFVKLFYPALFMSIVMSPFSLFFTSLVVVFYPFVILVFNSLTKNTRI